MFDNFGFLLCHSPPRVGVEHDKFVVWLQGASCKTMTEGVLVRQHIYYQNETFHGEECIFKKKFELYYSG